MKKLISLLAASALLLGLAACGDFAPDPVETPELALDYEYTAGTFPALGCSPSYAPLGEAVAAIMLGTTREEGAEAVSWAESSEAAWDALASGGTGVAVAADTGSVPSGVDAAPIARDALVFYVGGGSSVDSLDAGELEAIFTGRETGWEAFGGEGEIEILARGEGSASIAALGRLIGCDEGLVTGESLPLTGDNVIGFGLWSECCLMGLADGYRLLSVGGAEPTAQNIASGAYSLGVDVLAGVSASAAEDSGERALWLWLQGSVGQAFLSSQGYMEAVR